MICHSLWSLITVIFCWNRRRHNCGPMTLKWFPWISNPIYMVDLSSWKPKYLFVIPWNSPVVLTQCSCCGRRKPWSCSIALPHSLLPWKPQHSSYTGSQNFRRCPLCNKQNQKISHRDPWLLVLGAQPALVPEPFAQRLLQCIQVFGICVLHLELSEWVILLARVL